ncbi:MAG: succinate dehydrogenase, hydrophobic membrane anchor protein [Alphaproteobacteria bacterium]|nr:succinate dehydrogenase, hydrophobic membrane anchor protein [Alphaproteobacteria bacterium]
MNMRTPLGNVRGLGAAHSGTEHFLHQRLTALANIPLSLFLFYLLIPLIGMPYAQVSATFSHPFLAIFTLLSILSMSVHMRLGMQTIIEDYIHVTYLKIPALLANTLFCILTAMTGIFAVLKISFGV